jgi:hypothetical protein
MNHEIFLNFAKTTPLLPSCGSKTDKQGAQATGVVAWTTPFLVDLQSDSEKHKKICFFFYFFVLLQTERTLMVNDEKAYCHS